MIQSSCTSEIQQWRKVQERPNHKPLLIRPVIKYMGAHKFINWLNFSVYLEY